MKIVRKLAFILLCTLAIAPLCTAQSQIAGDWQGVVNAPDRQVHVVLHIAAVKNGLTATIDAAEMNATGVPVTTIALKDAKLTLSVDTAPGAYEGTVNKDATEIAGEWSQEGQPFELIFHRPAPSIAGDWQGVVTGPERTVHVTLHLVAAADGSLSASVDAPEMDATVVPADSVAFKDSKLTFVISAAPGTYEGTVNKDATEITGTWTSDHAVALNFKRAAAPEAARPVPPSDIDGAWAGALDVGSTKLHLILNIANSADGLTAKLQSTDQSPAWIAATTVSRTGSTFAFDIKPLGAVFEGKFAPDLTSIGGTFTQQGTAMPLVLARVKEQAR